MAMNHTACAAKFSPVMACDGMLVAAVEAVDADPIAPMGLARAVAIASITEMQTDMGAAPVCAEKQQISWSQQAVIVGECRNPLAEPLLLIGVSRNPNALAGEGHLHQTRTIHVWLGGSAP